MVISESPMTEERTVQSTLSDMFKEERDRNAEFPEEFVFSFGSARDALLHSVLFQPELSELGDSILLAWNVRDSESQQRFRDAIENDPAGSAKIEASFNFVEVGYLFGPNGRNSTDAEDHFLAKLLRDSWDAWLGYSYPNRHFVIEVLGADETGSTVGLHFFENRQQSSQVGRVSEA